MSNIDKELEDDEEFSKFMESEEDTNEKSTSDTNDVTADELFKSIDELFKTDEEKSTASKLNENEKDGSNLTETVTHKEDPIKSGNELNENDLKPPLCQSTPIRSTSKNSQKPNINQLLPLTLNHSHELERTTIINKSIEPQPDTLDYSILYDEEDEDFETFTLDQLAETLDLSILDDDEDDNNESNESTIIAEKTQIEVAKEVKNEIKTEEAKSNDIKKPDTKEEIDKTVGNKKADVKKEPTHKQDARSVRQNYYEYACSVWAKTTQHPYSIPPSNHPRQIF